MAELDPWEMVAAEHRAQAEADDADPGHAARVEARRAADHSKAVRLGWLTTDGDAILQPDDDADDDADGDE